LSDRIFKGKRGPASLVLKILVTAAVDHFGWNGDFWPLFAVV